MGTGFFLSLPISNLKAKEKKNNFNHLESEANQAEHHLSDNFKSRIAEHHRLELVCLRHMSPYVLLQILHAKQSQDKPQFQRAKSSPEGYLPVTVVRSRALPVVLQVQRVNVKGVYHVGRVFQPHCRAVKVHQHPFVGVKVERVCLLYAVHQVTKFRAYEGWA